MTDELTHFCDWDAPGGRTVRAICGTIIRRRDHQNEPTCTKCQAVLVDREAEAIIVEGEMATGPWPKWS
jgi:hypothetical protein